MTARLLRSRLAAIVFALQALAAFGAARGLVVCVGTAGHVAVEDPDAAARCRASAIGLDSGKSKVASAFHTPPACVDTPLLGAASERSTPSARNFDTVLATTSVVALPRMDRVVGRVAWTREPPPSHARHLRSVILLI